ncbi:MAG: hypothetical protein JWM10_4564 [Myxococcaceae bacterium]|nr:hypothetical protein [Myxococcaceae bacterium]
MAAALLVGCGGELASPTDPEVEHIPADAELAEGADVPLLPPIVDDDDAAIVEDAAVVEDVPMVVDVATPTVDVRAIVDAPAMVDARAMVDVPARVDAPPARDVPVTPRCEGSASGQSGVWTCTGNGSARERCVSGRVESDACANGCVRRPSGSNDVCAPRCTGSASGQSGIWTCTSDERSRQRCVLGEVESDACRFGCQRRPSGTNDVCASAPPPPPTALPGCAHRALLHWGLHPDASDRLRCAGVPDARIVQTIGNAAASAGTHAADGTANGLAYAAATDISTRGLSTADIHELLTRLANQGFAAWYRWPGHDGWPSDEAPHIHAIYVGCRMKASLRSQVGSWLAGRNGLVSNTVYGFHTWTAAQRALIRAVYDRFN